MTCEAGRLCHSDRVGKDYGSHTSKFSGATIKQRFECDKPKKDRKYVYSTYIL